MRKISSKILVALSLWPLALAPASITPAIAQSIRDYQFYDAEDHWAAVCIQGIGAEGLMKGYEDGRFQPNGGMTRAEFAAVMVKAFPNAPKIREAVSFSDVAPDFWGKEAIATAYERGFLTGYPDNIFKPNQAISRAQAIIVIAKTQNLPPVISNAALDRFVDARQIPTYAKNDIAASTLQGLVVNYPRQNQLRPNSSIKRGEAAALLCRVSKDITSARYYVPSQYIAGVEPPPLLSQIPVGSEIFSAFNNSKAILGDRLFFWGRQNNIATLWATDGTEAGTQQVSTLTREQAQGRTIQAEAIQAGSINVLNDQLWLQTQPRAVEGSLGKDIPYDFLAVLWRSDGTDAGTQAIATLNPELPKILDNADTWLIVDEDDGLMPNGKRPFVITGPKDAQIWQTDGTTSGTQRLATFPYRNNNHGEPIRVTSPRNFIQLSDYTIFTAYNNDERPELWRTDGTPEGTALFKDFAQTTIVPRLFTPVQDRAYFTVGTPELGTEPWVTEGTRKSTAILKDIYPGPQSSGARFLTNLGKTYFFLANSDQGMELWATEGTPASTRLVKRLSPNVVYDGNLTYATHDGKLFFATPTLETDDPDSSFRVDFSFDLWVSDGSAEGTHRLGNVINNGIPDFTPYKGRLFFSGYKPTNGQELWVSDGSAEGTYQVTDLAPGGDIRQENCLPQTVSPTWEQIVSSPNNVPKSPRCVFRPVAYNSAPRSLTVLGDYLYFVTDDEELFRTDGTARGMQKIESVDDEYDLFQAELMKLGDRLLVTGTRKDNRRSQLWMFQEN